MKKKYYRDYTEETNTRGTAPEAHFSPDRDEAFG